jgi:hypothetical protein
MLKPSDEAFIKNRIKTDVEKLSTYAEAGLPKTNNLAETTAGELWLASLVVKEANARLAGAQERALATGVIIDKTVSTHQPGPQVELWSGTHFYSTVDVRKGAMRTDVNKLKLALLKLKVKQATIDAALATEGVVTQQNHAHTFHIIPRTGSKANNTNGK